MAGYAEAIPTTTWFQSTCLLLIDIQTDFWSGNGRIRSAFPQFPERIKALLQLCRANGIEVCHVLERANAADSAWHAFWCEMNQGRSTDSGGAAEAWAAPQQGELVFYKHAYDAIGMDCGLEGHLKQASARCNFPLVSCLCQSLRDTWLMVRSAVFAVSLSAVWSPPAVCFRRPAPFLLAVSG
jgi:hypothetical protein